MSADLGPFEAFYDSALAHPGLLWIAAAAGLALALARKRLRPEVRAYLVGLCGLSVVDAWLTSNDVFLLGALPGAAARLVPLFFVLAGDYRYLLFVFAAEADGALRFRTRGLLRSGLLTLVVPS